LDKTLPAVIFTAQKSSIHLHGKIPRLNDLVGQACTRLTLKKIKGSRAGFKNHSIMKKGIHPDKYRLVVFKDMSNGHTFLSRSTAGSKETVKWEDGNEYPLVKLEISNTSHPFFTGKNMLVDTAGRIDKFKKKYAKKAE
jgi:large subunit ribosomal protein L31